MPDLVTIAESGSPLKTVFYTAAEGGVPMAARATEGDETGEYAPRAAFFGSGLPQRALRVHTRWANSRLGVGKGPTRSSP